MRQKLLFFDIDGTLAMPGHGVSDEDKRALEKAKENGHFIFINTGRTDKDIPNYVKEIDFDGGVYSAGGKVVFHDKVLNEATLSTEELAKIRDVLDEYNINYNLEGVKNNYSVNVNEFKMPEEEIEKLSTELQRFVRGAGMSTPRPVKDYDGEPVYKVNFRVNEENPELIDLINDRLGKDFRIDYFTNIFSNLGTIAGEITNFSINKGHGMEILSDYLDIPIEDTIAFGDSTNDLDMIKTAGLGVAMGNASEDIKEAAGLVCENCLDNGISKTLNRLEISA